MSCAICMFYVHRGDTSQYGTMKSFLLLCVVLAAGGLDAHTVQLSGSQKDRAHQHTLGCIKQTGIKPEVIAEAKKGNLNESEDLKKFTLCFFQKSGIVGSDGKLNVESALAKLPPGVDKAEAMKVLEDCKTKKGKTPEDTAFQIFKCYHSGTNTHIAL